MGETLGQILAVLATLAIFLLIILGTLWPTIADKGEEIDGMIEGTSYSFVPHDSVDAYEIYPENRLV